MSKSCTRAWFSLMSSTTPLRNLSTLVSSCQLRSESSSMRTKILLVSTVTFLPKVNCRYCSCGPAPVREDVGSNSRVWYGRRAEEPDLEPVKRLMTRDTFVTMSY